MKKITITTTCHREEKFGAVALNITVNELAEAGIEFGDSIDLAFSGEKLFEDIPYDKRRKTQKRSFLQRSFPRMQQDEPGKVRRYHVFPVFARICA